MVEGSVKRWVEECVSGKTVGICGVDVVTIMQSGNIYFTL